MGEVNKAAEYCLLAHERYQTWGAIGKCTSLFKFFDGTLNERVASSPAIANANEVQSDLASLLPQNSHQNTEYRKRRAGDHSSGNPEH
mmetsp:Transcript_18160/g.26855  ORF Transcript_18160/g.26855 Transcript_18160/m.26855 type:complete len:88 (-) Transcript_18160:358-621(-)